MTVTKVITVKTISRLMIMLTTFSFLKRMHAYRTDIHLFKDEVSKILDTFMSTQSISTVGSAVYCTTCLSV